MLTGNIYSDALGILIAVISIIIAYYKWCFSYWTKRNVPYVSPTIPYGNIGHSKHRKMLGLEVAEIYKTMKKQGYKHAGFYLLHQPVYLPIDTDIIKNIMTRDFNHFVNRGVYFNEKIDPLSAHLFAIEDDKWKNLRTKLTPTFTSGKLKGMFDTFVSCTTPMQETIEKLNVKNENINFKELVACYTTDIIGSCAFGIECNTFKDPNSDFRKYGREAFMVTPIRRFMLLVFPKLAKLLGTRAFDKEVTTFFSQIVKSTVAYRDKNKYKRNDFMQLLIDLRNTETSLTINEVEAQAFIFFIAGFDTSSTTLTFCLYELAKNMYIQDKLRKEIINVLNKHQGNITYEAVSEMQYLEQTIQETLRKHPPVTNLRRICNKDYAVPNKDLVIEKGTRVFINTYGIQHDPENYPDPEKFDPDRFSDENKNNIKPYTFLPFGEGPRICIGLRFGMLQTKVGLISILSKFKLKTTHRTPRVLTYDPRSLILSTKEPIYLGTEKV